MPPLERLLNCEEARVQVDRKAREVRYEAAGVLPCQRDVHLDPRPSRADRVGDGQGRGTVQKVPIGVPTGAFDVDVIGVYFSPPFPFL